MENQDQGQSCQVSGVWLPGGRRLYACLPRNTVAVVSKLERLPSVGPEEGFGREVLELGRRGAGGEEAGWQLGP